MLRGKGLLTPIQRTFLAAFTRLPDHVHFYLAGGTALAEYYLGHRLSFDLDLFSAEASLILPFSYQVAVDLYFILQQAELQQLMTQAAQKDPGFDLYWFAVALGQAADLPNELEHWPVRMLQGFDPSALKAQFQELAIRLMEEITAGK